MDESLFKMYFNSFYLLLQQLKNGKLYTLKMYTCIKIIHAKNTHLFIWTLLKMKSDKQTL